MNGETHIQLNPKDGWHVLDIREYKGGLLIQVWATVIAVAPEPCPEQSAQGLVWPGVADPMTHARADALVESMPVYLDDRFLERYEQSSFFDTTPVKAHGQWHVSPSYGGQWSFTDCVRVGRNLIKVPMRELYKPKPDREILHADAHALDPAQVSQFNKDAEHIVAKTDRLVDQLVNLADHLATLSTKLSLPKVSTDIFPVSRSELCDNGWVNYPELCRLAQVVPLSMTEQDFLSRCKSIHELWQCIPNGLIRKLIQCAGHARSDIKDLGSIKLLQVLTNIVE